MALRAPAPPVRAAHERAPAALRGRDRGALSGGAVAALPPVAVCLVCLWLAVDDGGFYERTWSAAAVAVAALVLVLALAGWRLRSAAATPGRVALAALAGLAVWSFATALWAAAPGRAVDGAVVVVVYLAAFAIPAIWPCSPAACARLLRAVALCLAALGAVAVIRAAHDANELVYARLAWPTGYPNATAAMDALGAWLALVLAARTGGRLSRAACFGAAVWLAGLVILTQSRGAVFTAPAAALVLVLLAPRRLAAALHLVLALLLLAPALPVLLRVLGTAPERQDEALARASLVLALVAVLAVGVHASLSGVLDSIAPTLPRALRRLVVAGALAAALAALAFSISSGRVGEAWHELTGTSQGSGAQGSTRFTALGSNRADFWRVGLDAFEEHPLGGIGVDNFQATYLRERHSDEEPRAPHSLLVTALAETGLIGTALLAVFVVAVAAVLAPAARRAGPASVVAHASAVALTGWLLHAGLDWLWEMPAAGALAFAVAGLGVGATALSQRPAPRPVLRAGVGVAAVAVALVAGTLWLADRLEARALATWRADPAAARSDLHLASRLDPLGTDALVLQGAIAARRSRWAEMRAAYAAAAARDGSDWYVQRELAAAESRLGDRAAARVAARRAAALNPRAAGER